MSAAVWGNFWALLPNIKTLEEYLHLLKADKLKRLALSLPL